MATKNRTFYAYKIVNETVSHATSGLRNDLQQKLTSAYDNFGNRCKPIADGSPVEDVLACYIPLAQTPDGISGEMWRIAPSEDMPKIPRELFAQAEVKAEDVPDDPNVSPTDKSRLDLHYFLISDDILISSFPPSRSVAFAKYLNELLTIYRGGRVYKFDPLVILPADIKLSDISSVTFSDKPILENGKIKSGKSKFGIFKTGGLVLKNMFDDYGNTNDLINQKILSATMTLKLSKPRKMSDEVYQQKLSAILKPLSAGDAEGVTFKLKDGKEIKAMMIQAKMHHTFNDDDATTKDNVKNAYAVMSNYLTSLR